MLLVAIPKSASTSLLSTLGELHDMEARQIFFPENKIPRGVRVLHRFHSDIRHLTQREVDRFSDPTTIYKQHIYPTEANKLSLKQIKKVILLRKPRDILLSYFRSKKTYVSEGYPGMEKCKSETEWLEKSKEIGIYQDLEFFYEEWIGCDDALIVHFEDLIAQPKRTINRIEDYWGLEHTERQIALQKKRYTRIPQSIAYLRKLGTRLKEKIQHRERTNRLDLLVVRTTNLLFKTVLSPELWDTQHRELSLGQVKRGIHKYSRKTWQP